MNDIYIAPNKPNLVTKIDNKANIKKKKNQTWRTKIKFWKVKVQYGNNRKNALIPSELWGSCTYTPKLLFEPI